MLEKDGHEWNCGKTNIESNMVCAESASNKGFKPKSEVVAMQVHKSRQEQGTGM